MDNDQIPEEEILSEDIDQELGSAAEKAGRGKQAGLAHMSTVQRHNYYMANRPIESAGASSDQNQATA